MASRVTLKDVAALAGVSLATTSRALADKSNASPKAREKVLAAASELNYTPNSMARSLRSAKTHAIGLLVSDIRNPHFASLAHRIQTTLLTELGYSTILGNASEDARLQDLFLDQVSQQRIDGLIIAPQKGRSDALEALVRQGLPTVFVDRIAAGFDVPYVCSDSRPGIEEALDHLQALGHRTVGFVAGPQETSTGSERVECFRQGAPHRFGAGAHVEMSSADSRTGVPATERLLSLGCTAIVYGYSPHVVGGLDVIERHGLRIPDDVSLIAFDDQPTFRFFRPRLTVIRQDVDAMGRAAVRLLQETMASHPTQSLRLTTEVIVRESTAAPIRKGGRA